MAERIGALADGGLASGEAQAALDALLADPRLWVEWERIHAVGDCLRSEETGACRVSPGFMDRFAQRLESEPALLAPAALQSSRSSWRRVGLPGLSVAAAIVAVALVAFPQRSPSPAGVPVAENLTTPAPAPVVASAPPASDAGVRTVAADQTPAKPVDAAQLREYLAAHQQYSSPQLNGMGTFHAAAWSTSKSDNANP